MANQVKSSLSLQPAPIKIFLYLLLALTLIRGIIYASVVPPWQAPDEPPHFERAKAALTTTDWNSTAVNGPAWYNDLAKSLFTFGYWDFLDDNRPAYSPDTPINQYIGLYQELYDGVYGSRPAYAMIGWPLFLASNQEIVLQLYLVRLNTVLMSVGIILFSYLITQTIFPNDVFLILGVPILILFNPQHTHMLSTVNNGNLAELLATVALYFMVKAVVKGFSWFNILMLVSFSLAAMWTKATAYFLPIVIGCFGMLYLWRYRRYWRWLIPVGLVLATGIYIFAPERVGMVIAQAWNALKAGAYYLDPIVPEDLFKSFWAMPGWTIFRLDSFWYQVLGVSCVLAVIGLMIAMVKNWRLLQSAQFRPQIQSLIILAIATIVAIVTLLSWNALTNSIVYRQGRSIYPVIVPISLFLMLGWQHLIPSGWRQIGLLLIAQAFFLFDSLVLFQYIIPFFYSRY